ncbi:Gcv operon activator [Kingella potus]|uniref:Gcv operon activator n=1 Tax=Kingella potus TaxID=265175 RepID=A0A377QWZ4_9NEIS|nr:LysR family transcriptional regulator [Kingella potus]UOP01767.1 LysR family transcriptional regulator [Kingella potus]STQ99924.1 Gcv operon activator [Kingella potus]
MNNWDDLLYFNILVEKQTLTAAAETLGVQHSTIARRIARLEQTLGLRLFDRIGRRYLLTGEGARIHAQVREIAVGMDTLLRTAQEQREAVAEVVVSAPPLVLKGLLMPRFPEFARRHTHIRLVLQSDAQLSNLHERQADIALRIVRPQQNDLAVRRLRPVFYRFYAHAAYLANCPPHKRAYCHFTAHGRHSLWAAERLAHRRIILACNDFDVIKAAIAAQTGIGWLPDFYVLPPDNFVQISLNDDAAQPEEFAADIYLVMHEDVRRSPKIRAVADFLTEVLAK